MIRITSWASLSAQGLYNSTHMHTHAWAAGKGCLEWDSDRKMNFGKVDEGLLIPSDSSQKSWEKGADKVTLMARTVGGLLSEKIKEDDRGAGVIFASSRGAAETLERSVLAHAEGKRIHPVTSPWTTLGSTAAWVARDLGLKGSAIDLSMTCSSGLHALYQAVAILESGREDRRLVGASEAPLSAYGSAQFAPRKVLSHRDEAFPRKP